MKIRTYRDSDFTDVLSAWNRSMTLDSITAEDFARRVLLDENFDPDGLLVAESDGRAIGFCLCLVFRRPIEGIGRMEHRGFVTAFGVAPEKRRDGAGTALFDAAETFFRKQGRREVTIAPYLPNYFIPGVDVDAYRPAIEFLKARGFAKFAEEGLAMDALIGQFCISPEILDTEKRLAAEGVRIEILDASRLVAFLRFLMEALPGDWIERARGRLAASAESTPQFDSVVVAVDGERVVGYCQYDGEHFGPFGVAETHRGMGIGSVILARTLLRMRERGHHSAYCLWTGERAANGIYRRLGFQVTRRFELLCKEI